MISRISLVASVVGLLALTGSARSEEAPPPPPEVAPAAPEAAPMAAPMATPPPTAPEPAAAPAAAPSGMIGAPTQSFKMEPSPGNTIKIGLLLQPQFQSLGSTELSGNSYNLLLRRTRLLVGGTLYGAFEYFFDTDYPNLFLAANEAPTATTAATTTKATPGMNVQDAFITWKPVGDVFKVDAGYMLPPMAHNAVQGAGTLYSLDYFAFTFLSTAGTILGSAASPVGRDLGVQLRGLVLGGHLEYRLGLFQGKRNTETPAALAGAATTVGSTNFFRAVGRLQINLLDAEPGFFYAGTYLGKKKILSIGLSGDTQSSYHYVAGDVFADLPVGPGVFTAQVDVAHWDGGTFVAIAKETAIMGEVGFNIAALQLSPIVHLEHLWGGTSSGGVTSVDQSRLGGGLAYWPFGHGSNLKAFYTRNTTAAVGQHADNQFNVQWQLYFF
jgi:Phosphate-selective porin O and P